MSEHSLPITTASEEEWKATIRYADEHAAEFAPPSRQAPGSLGDMLFQMAIAMNQALAEQYRRKPPTH